MNIKLNTFVRPLKMDVTHVECEWTNKLRYIFPERQLGQQHFYTRITIVTAIK